MNAKNKVLAALLFMPVLAACGTLSKSLAPLPNSWDGQSFSSTSMPRAGAGDQSYATPVATAVADYPKAYPTATAGAWPTEGRGPGPTPRPQEGDGSRPPVNPFVETYADHLSTFALDVDTASYTRARDALLAGRLPDPYEVRVEEFVNYFRQDYSAPPDVAFAVYADAAPSPFHTDGSYLLRIGVQGYRVSDEERKPLVLTFVIDVSGSMASEGKLEMVKEALAQLARQLRPSDSVAIVAYSTEAWTVLEPTSGYEHDRIINAVYTLYPTNTTNVEAGLRLGYEWAWSAFRADASNRVILCSDGVANEGNTEPDGILEYVHGYTERGITLTAVGVGLGEYNDSLLERLADKGDGNYFYVDSYEEARRVLVDDLVSTLQVIALNAKIQVDFNPEVVSRYRLIGYENRAVADRDFRNDSVDAGEIGAGHSATAVYVVQFREGAAGRIATLQLRWEDPDSLAVHEINGNFNTWDISPSFEAASPRFQLTMMVAQFAEILRGSPWAAIYQLRMLSQSAYQLTELLPEDSDVRELAGLISMADQLTR